MQAYLLWMWRYIFVGSDSGLVSISSSHLNK
jgi:hypothetical protein